MPLYPPIAFGSYVLRTPLFPLDRIIALLDDFSEAKMFQLYQNPYWKEAIYIASPDLSHTLEKYLANPSDFTASKKEAVQMALLRYVSRACSRCTPFGLFAGCSVGAFADQTKVVMAQPEQFKRLTQFDMDYWSALLQDFAGRTPVRPYLKYYANNSLYEVSGFYRYIDYKIVAGKREYSIAGLRKTDYLEKVLKAAKKGIGISQIADLLTDDPSEKEDAIAFAEELIEARVLSSNLEATLTHPSEWERVLQIIGSIPVLSQEKKHLEEIKMHLEKLDLHLAPEPEIRQHIQHQLDETGVGYDEKYLFQTDANTATDSNLLDRNIIEPITRTLFFLNGIQPYRTSQAHQNFTRAFSKRYDTREMPLATVLDAETGIGYQSTPLNPSAPLLEKFPFEASAVTEKTETWSEIDRILESKLQRCIREGKTQLTLGESDFPDFTSDWNQLPATFSVMIELLELEKQPTIYLASSGDSSAVKLLARFCNGNVDIDHLTREIVAKETVCHNGKILAEVVHIPEARTGNVLRRPRLRDYEIPYLAASSAPADCQIGISDLMVSVRNKRIVLRSKKHDKEVVPFLSNAHNYPKSSLPVYHFLCDLQTQQNKPIYSFGWGILESHYDYFPRVYYRDVLISKAKWKIHPEEIATFYPPHPAHWLALFHDWKTAKKLPRWVNCAQHDHTLLVDLEQQAGIRLFLTSVKNQNPIILEEFLFGETVVQNASGERFTNQIIVPFYKQKNSEP